MSRASALIWVTICVVLGLLVWWTTPRTIAPTEGPPLVAGFGPGDVRAIRITGPDGATTTIDRAPLEGLWLLKPHAGEIRSVVDGSRVQGFLRLLSNLRVANDADPRPMPRAAIVQILGATGTLASLAVDPEFLAGKGRVALLTDSGTAARVATTADDLAALIRPEALAEWRSNFLLPWPPERSNAVQIRRPTTGLTLERSGAGWLLTTPVRLRAEPSAAQGVSLWLANAALDRFVEDASSDGFSKPSRTVVLATDSAERRRVEHRLELGPQLDARSSLIRLTGIDAESGRTLWGPSVAVVQNSLLAGISDDPAVYLTKVSFTFPAADVRGVGFPESGTQLTRGADGGFGDADATVRALLRLLTELPAANVALMPGDAPSASPDATRVVLLGLNNAALGEALIAPDSIPARTEGSPSVPAIRVTIDRVQRLIPVERPRDFLAAVRELLKVP